MSSESNTMLDAPSRRRPLSTQVVEQIRERIASGEWAVGSKIAPESQLTKTLGISRNTVREALRSLVHAGLLESRVGDGTYVVATTELQVAMRRRVSRGSSEDAFEVRAILERNASSLAAERATPEQIDTMRQLLDMRDAAVDAPTFLGLDLEFHRAVADSSGNALLAELYRNLDEISGSIGTSADASDTFVEFRNRAQSVNDKHRDLLAAIAGKHPAVAAEYAEQIVLEARAIHGGVTR